MKNKVIKVIFLIILLFCLTGCSNENTQIEEKNSINGYYTYIPVFNGKTTVLIPIYHNEENITNEGRKEVENDV